MIRLARWYSVMYYCPLSIAGLEPFVARTVLGLLLSDLAMAGFGGDGGKPRNSNNFRYASLSGLPSSGTTIGLPFLSK